MGAISKEVRLEMLQDEVASAGPEAVEIFTQCLEQGQTLEFAAMCALRQAPGSKNTDRAFCEGAERQKRMMSKVNRDAVYEIAKKAGISTQGKYYKGSLGRPNDPLAWVSNADDVLVAAKKKNLSVSGVVNYTAPDRDPRSKPKVRLAPDLVKKYAAELLSQEPDTAAKVKENPKSLREVVERVVDKHGSKRK